jgi:hypothetical protein
MTTTPAEDISARERVHANEHALELPASAIELLRSEVQAMGAQLVRKALPDFVIYPVAPRK